MQVSSQFNKKISVITVSKDDLKGLMETIKSVKNQTYQNYEQIIVIKNPSDEALNFLSRQNQSQIKTFIQICGGIYNAMNTGLVESSGELLIFLNSGDRFHSNYVLSKIIQIYEEDKFLWAIGDYHIEFEEFKAEIRIKKSPSFNDLYNKRIKINHQATVYSRKIIDSLNKFDDKYVISGDYEYNLRAILISKPQLLEFFVATIKSGGISQEKVFKSSYEDFKIRITFNKNSKGNYFSTFLLFFNVTIQLVVSKVIKKTMPKLYKFLQKYTLR